MQTIEHPDADYKKSLNELAQDKLSELNNIKETYELSMLGDYRIRKGALVDIKIPKYNIDDVFLIKTTTHTITSNKEFVHFTMDKHKTN